MIPFYALYEQIHLDGEFYDESMCFIADTQREMASFLGIDERTIRNNSELTIGDRKFKVYKYYISKDIVYEGIDLCR